VAVVLRLAAFLPRHRMGVVEAHQALAILSVQRQREVLSVRPLRRHWRNHETDPITALRAQDEHLSVEVEKHAENWITQLCDGFKLSN
jgi:hypothetical protein